MFNLAFGAPEPESFALPHWSYLPVNRCNLPANRLGTLEFQRHPEQLILDTVEPLYQPLFQQLQRLPTRDQRQAHFRHYMTQRFDLSSSRKPSRMEYPALLGGWREQPNGPDAALLKAWVESRFGLLTRYHGRRITSANDRAYFIAQRDQYSFSNTTCFAQLDLAYSYSQYEFQQPSEPSTLQLYRGVEDLAEHDVYSSLNQQDYLVLLNNLSAFSADPEQARTHGSCLLQVDVPRSKVLFCPSLFPDSSPPVYAVLGGLYQVRLGVTEAVSTAFATDPAQPAS